MYCSLYINSVNGSRQNNILNSLKYLNIEDCNATIRGVPNEIVVTDYSVEWLKYHVQQIAINGCE